MKTQRDVWKTDRRMSIGLTSVPRLVMTAPRAEGATRGHQISMEGRVTAFKSDNRHSHMKNERSLMTFELKWLKKTDEHTHTQTDLFSGLESDR